MKTLNSTVQILPKQGVKDLPLPRVPTPLLKGAQKRFLELYHKGSGISNKELKKLAPAFYSGDRSK